MKLPKYIVVGSGLFGSVVAERIASLVRERVLVIDRRSHVGGNSYSEVDDVTGIEYHKYGSHIFHTNMQHVVEYISNFIKLNSYQHKVFSEHQNKIYTMPINLKTINDFYGCNLTPLEAESFMRQESRNEKVDGKNLEERAVSQIGRKLYDAFIKNYTFKQWNIHPKDLPASIINRLPVRYNYNNNYFNDTWQGIPMGGYGKMFEKMLTHPYIEISLETSLKDIISDITPRHCVIYTGMLDELLDFQYGVLGWRSLRFEWETHPVLDYQGTSVINYPDVTKPYTRIHEFKHYHPERKEVFDSQETIICKEYPADYTIDSEAYYPVMTDSDISLYQKYLKLAKERYPHWVFGGRLASYRYWDMDKTIENALLVFDTQVYKKGVL